MFVFYKGKLIEEMIKKIHLSKQQNNNFKNAKIKAKLQEHFKKKINDKTYLMNFI
jgi:hypothetical protein